MIPYGKQTIEQDDVDEVIKTLKSDFLTCGPKVKEFETIFAKKVKAKYAIAVSSGTTALHLACLAAELNKNEELITSPITFAASANCALYCQAKPVFADIDENGLIDPQEIIKRITKNTKIIIPVHYTGLPCNMEEISKIAKENNLIVIEDACHALGAKYKNTTIGDCTYSDMSVFSFHPVKHITTGEGGMITTNSKEIYDKLLLLRSHGISKNPTNNEPWNQEMNLLGYNYRISDIQCALGISQLKKIDKFVKKRREIAQKYDELLNIEHINETKESISSYHLYVIKTKNRLNLFNKLKNNNIICQVHYRPVYLHPYYLKLGYKKGLCPKAEDFYGQIISIPIYPLIKDEEIKQVIKIINEE